MADFGGLPHRCETVREREGVVFINDSKGTNVGATLAALEGLGSPRKQTIHLIAGGVGKGADFSSLAPALAKFVSHLYVFGKDAQHIIDIVPEGTAYSCYDNLEQIIDALKSNVKQEDVVLFSPACASFDQYKSFEHRGDHFKALVAEL